MGLGVKSFGVVKESFGTRVGGQGTRVEGAGAMVLHGARGSLFSGRFPDARFHWQIWGAKHCMEIMIPGNLVRLRQYC